jgi:hypothetical protein
MTNVIMAHDGSVWLEEIEFQGTRRYLVVGSFGEPVGTIALGANAWIAVAWADRIWVVEEDDLGVESIVRYHITWG